METNVHTFTPGPSSEEFELKEDHRKTIEALNVLSSTAQSTTGIVKNMAARMETGEWDMSAGLSILDLRNVLMADYMANLMNLSANKCMGQSLQNGENRETILRIVEMRTSLEKIKPILFKLKYRIEKLVKAANTKTVDSNDPINLRPNLQALDLDDEDEDRGATGGEQTGNREKSATAADHRKNKKYVVPKVSSVPYEEDGEEAKKNKALEKAKKKALSSSVMQELRAEFDDAPEEISEQTVGRRKAMKQVKERVRFEEENMIRLKVPKQKRRRDEALMTIGDLGSSLTMFGDVSALDQTADDLDSKSKKNKSQKLGGKSGKRRSVSKRFRRKK